MTDDECYSEAITILTLVRQKITYSSDLMWSSYETADELHAEIDLCMEGLMRRSREALVDAHRHFLPASTFQELSLQNGWTEAYHQLAARFDKVYTQLTSVR